MIRRLYIIVKILALFGLFIGYTGCINSSSDNFGNFGSKVLTGYFSDDPVEGLYYETNSQWGFTGSDGAFHYLSGEWVYFYVGDILIGETIGASEITPFDLAGADPPETNLEIVRIRNEIERSNTITSLEVALNIAMFLQSLDDDGVLSNGIQIPSTIDDLALGMSLNFSQDPWEFRDDFSFRTLMAEGRNANVWGGTRAVKSPLYVLDSLYEGLSITPEIYAPSVYEGDNNGDGFPDEREEYFYDTAGNMDQYTYDNNADGGIEEIGQYTYDANGNVVERLWDYDGDLIADEGETEIYDANGNLIEFQRDTDGDSTPEDRYEYEYDNYGNRTSYQRDYDNNGQVDWVYTYEYDSDGNMIQKNYDDNNDSNWDWVETYEYDIYGNEILRETDSNYDGTIDERTASFYDANGNLTEWWSDSDGDTDGNTDPDYIEKYYYDANGYLTEYREDTDGDGTDDYHATAAYDANGNMISVQIDSDYDTVVDESDIYAYDANGNITEYEEDYGNNGSVDYRQTYEYDINGNLTDFYEDDDGDTDGNTDASYSESYQYQAIGGFKGLYFWW